jgi:hypothetical protein
MHPSKWQPPVGFDERTTQHLEDKLARVLREGQTFILTHATRGEIAGRTTRILLRLHLRHGLQDVPLLQACDAPHDRQGYAIEKSADKQVRVAKLLRKYKTSLLAAMRAGRLLVAGKFAQGVVKRLGSAVAEAMESWCIKYPSC